MRVSMRRFARPADGFFKTFETCGGMVAIHAVSYKFLRPHNILRVTPATRPTGRWIGPKASPSWTSAIRQEMRGLRHADDRKIEPSDQRAAAGLDRRRALA